MKGLFMLKMEPDFSYLKISLVTFCILQTICISATSRVPRHTGQSES